MRKLHAILFSAAIAAWSPNAYTTGNHGGNKGGGKNHHGGGNNHGGGGNNNGGDNNGDNNGGNDNDNASSDDNNQQSQQNEKDSKKWRMTVVPVPYIDFDFGRKVTIEDEAGPNAKLVGGGTRYRVIKYYTIDVGLGVAGVFHEVPVTLSSFVPIVGILPIVGREAQLDRHVMGREAVDQVKYLSVQPAPEEVLAWENGDSVTYQSRGALVFFGGAGIAAGVGGAISYMAEGDWTTRVEKASESSIIAKITRTKLNKYSANFGTFVSSLGVSEFKSTDDGFSFRYDMRDPNAVAAYQDFIRGNFAMTQRLVQAQSGSVQPERTIRVFNRGHTRSLFLGIPILANYVSSSGRVYNHSEVAEFQNQGSKVESRIEYGIYNFSAKKKFFFKHTNTVGSFFGSHFTTRTDGAAETSGEVGKFIWTYETDTGSPRKLQSSLEELSELTGLTQDLRVNPPVASEDLGYLNVQFTMDISPETTKQLVVIGGGYGLHNRVLNISAPVNNKLIANDCQNYQDQNGPDTCIDKETRRVESELRAVTESLQQMSLHYNRQDWPEFAKAYGAFGKAILQSRNTFQTFLSMVKGQEPVEMQLEISGEKLSRLRKVVNN